MSEKVVYSDKKGSKRTSGKKPKTSRRRPLNRHELEAPDDLNVSTSTKKLKLSDDLYEFQLDGVDLGAKINFQRKRYCDEYFCLRLQRRPFIYYAHNGCYGHENWA